MKSRGEEFRLTEGDYHPDLHRPRIVKLIDHLKEVERRDPASFNLKAWIRSVRTDDATSVSQATEEWPRRWADGETLNCNTTACLVGHLPLVFPDDFQWQHGELSGWYVRTKYGQKAEDRLATYFGLTWCFWFSAIYVSAWFWKLRSNRGTDVSAGEMARLLEEALVIVDKEVNPNSNEQQIE